MALRNFRSLLVGLLVLPSLWGCARQPQVESKQLPVRKVVVYRNGVAYFERRGEVESDQVHFKLRQENVGDFLATLAVLERGGHTVRAASFPVKMEEEQVSDDPELSRALDTWEHKKPDPRQLREVTLELDGERHDLSVGYLAETPLWRPSYRLVVGEKGEAVLQAWGIVQNQSGEDWEDVEIALVAGAPIAFQSTLGEPVIPPRPVVTDSGEMIQAVPESATTLYQREELEAPAEEMVAADEAEEDYALNKSSVAGSGSAAPPPKEARSAAKKFRSAPAAPSMASAAPRDPSRLARVEVQTGATRYEVPHRVTIPDQSATMVLLVSKKVPGEAVFLFSPDGGVPDSYSHPFRVARFKNESGGLLERGPIAVFEEGAFLGQGIVESLPLHAQATVPFALMRSVSIQSKTTYDQRGARLYAVRQGVLTIERDQATITAYELVNGGNEKARVLIRHRQNPSAKLWDPPAGTEEIAGEHSALVPVNVAAFGKAKLMVEERLPVQRQVDWQSTEARNAIRDYLKSTDVLPEVRKSLASILEHAAQLATLDDEERRLTREQRELERSTQETRVSLKAIKENPQAASLRRELTDRLAQGTRRLDAITKDLVELRLRRTEQEVRLKEVRQGLEIAEPDRRQKK